jgi:8-oxo-dGTP pyrophosphatase MutT (NUDIX family)
LGISEYIRRLRAAIGTELLLVPSATAAIFDEAGRLLLGLSLDTGRWSLVGGAIDPGESPAAAAIREAREETGLEVVVTSLIGVYSGPDFEVTYPNGDRTLYVVSLFAARPVSGKPTADGEELSELVYATKEEAFALPMAPLARFLTERSFARDRQY